MSARPPASRIWCWTERTARCRSVSGVEHQHDAAKARPGVHHGHRGRRVPRPVDRRLGDRDLVGALGGRDHRVVGDVQGQALPRVGELGAVGQVDHHDARVDLGVDQGRRVLQGELVRRHAGEVRGDELRLARQVGELLVDQAVLQARHDVDVGEADVEQHDAQKKHGEPVLDRTRHGTEAPGERVADRARRRSDERPDPVHERALHGDLGDGVGPRTRGTCSRCCAP